MEVILKRFWFFLTIILLLFSVNPIFATSALPGVFCESSDGMNFFASVETDLSKSTNQFCKLDYHYMTDRVVFLSETGHRKITLAGLLCGSSRAQCQFISIYFAGKTPEAADYYIPYEKNHRTPPIRADPKKDHEK